MIFLNDDHEIKFFENYQNLLAEPPTVKLAQHDSIANSENVEPMRLIIFPLPVDVFAVTNVDDCAAIESALLPLATVEGEIIINKQSRPMPQLVMIGAALVPGVAVVDSLLH